MPSLRLTVETITPLLMYGADQTEPELRGSSIRGSLRYWLRAVLGAKYKLAQKDDEKKGIENIFTKESDILGSTSKGSRISLRVQKSRRAEIAPDQWVLPEHTIRNDRTIKLRHKGFVGGSEFRITLSTHPLDDSGLLDDDSDLVKAVFLMAHLGGLGRRSRRGSGNLWMKDARGYDANPPLAILPEDRDDLRNYLANMATYVNENERVGHRPKFATFAPDTCVVLLGRSSETRVEDVLANNGDLWSASGRYHHAGGIFGDVRPRRSSAIHMRVANTRAGYVPQQTIFYSGNGAWGQMQEYIDSCLHSGMFELVYGNYKGWK